MLSLGPSQRYFLYRHPADMRKSFDGLAGLGRRELGRNPLSGDVFVFTNRTLEVEDWADENDVTWDAKPTTFVYDRAGNLIEMVETLSPVLDRTTEVLRLDERNLPERLRITLGTDQLGVNYAYDAGGQRIKKVTFTDGLVDPESDPHYAFERYVRDGMRLVGV